MKMPFGTENIANFLEESLQSKMPPKLSEEERQQNYDSPAPPEIHEDAPYIDHEACKTDFNRILSFNLKLCLISLNFFIC